MARKSLLLLAFAAVVMGQDGSSGTATSDTASSTRQPLTHTISVGKADHKMEPDIVQASVGDIIVFNFYPLNHSVIRAEYEHPCIPYEDTGVDKVGFFSGFKPVDAILDEPPSYSLLINDTDPIFYYCGASGSCINFQMVGVINPNATTSLATQKQLAKDSKYMLLPGQPFPSEDDTIPTTTTSTSSTHPTTATVTSTPTASPSASSKSHSGLSTGAIAGIAIGGAAIAIMAAALLFICGRKSRRRNSNNFANANQPLMGQHSPAPFSPHPGHMSFVPMDPNKHMSMQSTMISPPLPGYMPPPHHEAYGSPMGHYAPSGALDPGHHPDRSPNGSPNPIPAAPSYAQTMGNRGSMGGFPSNPHQSFNAPPPGPVQHNVHEMAAGPVHGLHQISTAPREVPDPSTSPSSEQQMAHERMSAISKGGSVERYQ